MKKTILTLAAFVLITGTIFTACNSPAEKVENAEEKVIDANSDLSVAQGEYAAEVAKYRKETADKIAANEKSIAEFKIRKDADKKEAKEEYQKKIAELELKNSDMKLKMDDYKETSKEEWEKFKTEFDQDMLELVNALNNFSLKNNK